MIEVYCGDSKQIMHYRNFDAWDYERDNMKVLNVYFVPAIEIINIDSSNSYGDL